MRDTTYTKTFDSHSRTLGTLRIIYRRLRLHNIVIVTVLTSRPIRNSVR